uniref:Cytosolic Fe-S cluster assembly factor NBP35 n=1 Tax=Magallana gigas TaxID=29159 RepID=K1QQF0_MAGGI
MGVAVLGLVENMSGLVCPCCKDTSEVFPGRGVVSLAESHNIPILGSLPMDPKVTECCENGRNPLENYPESPTVQGIMEISSRLIGLAIINHRNVYGFFGFPDYDKEHTAGVTGQQRMLTPPWQLILSLIFTEVLDKIINIFESI